MHIARGYHARYNDDCRYHDELPEAELLDDGAAEHADCELHGACKAADPCRLGLAVAELSEPGLQQHAKRKELAGDERVGDHAGKGNEPRVP